MIVRIIRNALEFPWKNWTPLRVPDSTLRNTKSTKSNGIKLNVSMGFDAQLGVSHAVTMMHYLQSIRPCFRPHGLWGSLFLHPVSFPFCVLVHFSLSCFYGHLEWHRSVCACVRAYSGRRRYQPRHPSHPSPGKFSLPPQKFEQTASAGTDIIKHTREFWQEVLVAPSAASFLPATPWCFIVSYSMHFRSVFLCFPSQC